MKNANKFDIPALPKDSKEDITYIPLEDGWSGAVVNY